MRNMTEFSSVFTVRLTSGSSRDYVSSFMTGTTPQGVDGQNVGESKTTALTAVTPGIFQVNIQSGVIFLAGVGKPLAGAIS